MAKMKGHLTLIGDEFNPDEVTAQLKVQPQWIKNKHDILGNGQEFGHYEWGIVTDLIEHYDLDPIVQQLADFIRPRTKLLAEIAKNCCAVWNILFDISSTEDFPATYFGADFIRLAAEINAELGLDPIIYPTGEGDEDLQPAETEGMFIIKNGKVVGKLTDPF